uniref:Uncharacterized protein n=1 Tax=Anguilla anguilla TaxID=7936 RepID=A0A0E9SV42_ANGAN
MWQKPIFSHLRSSESFHINHLNSSKSNPQSAFQNGNSIFPGGKCGMKALKKNNTAFSSYETHASSMPPEEL